MRRVLSMPRADYFTGWFENSVVTTDNGEPLMLCYGGTSPNTAVRPMMHFGPPETENHRLRSITTSGEPDPDELVARPFSEHFLPHHHRLKTVRSHPWGEYEVYDVYAGDAHLVPVFLNIQHPLVLDEDVYMIDVRVRGVEHESAAILKTLGYSDSIIRMVETVEDVADLIADAGYDGVSYPNISEGVGDRSWIILTGQQAWPILDGYPMIPIITNRF